MIIELSHALALQFDYDITYCDVSLAFVHAPEEEVIYVVPPAEAYHDDVPDPVGVGEVWQITRKLYGRRDAPQGFQAWSFAQFKMHGFKQSVLHPTSCYLMADNKIVSLITAHVDDWIVVSMPSMTEELIGMLSSSFMVKVTGSLPFGVQDSDWISFLGKERKRSGSRLLRRPKKKYIQDAAKVYNLNDAKGVHTPVTRDGFKERDLDPLDADEKKKFQSAVGSLIYLKDDMRLAQFALYTVTREMHAPTKALVMRVKRLIRYLLVHAEDYTFMEKDDSKFGIYMWADSDWAGSSSRKSVDCIVSFVNGMLVYMSVKQQSFIAQSSCEAELAGVHRATIVGLCLSNTWLEWTGELLDCKVHTDSRACLGLLARKGVGRIRHLEVKQLFCQQVFHSGRVVYSKCSSEENVADVGTKVQDASSLDKFAPLLAVSTTKEVHSSSGMPWKSDKMISRLSAVLLSSLLGVVKGSKSSDSHLLSQDVVSVFDVFTILIAVLAGAWLHWMMTRTTTRSIVNGVVRTVLGGARCIYMVMCYLIGVLMRSMRPPLRSAVSREPLTCDASVQTDAVVAMPLQLAFTLQGQCYHEIGCHSVAGVRTLVRRPCKFCFSLLEGK